MCCNMRAVLLLMGELGKSMCVDAAFLPSLKIRPPKSSSAQGASLGRKSASVDLSDGHKESENCSC